MYEEQNTEWFSESFFIVFVSLFVLIDLTIFSFGLLASITDPSDPLVKYERYCKLTIETFPCDCYDLYCQQCACHVQEKTKHCRKCKRCTAQFDHHCIWLNNCIGAKNYCYFIVLIVTVMLQALFHVCMSLFVIYKFYMTPMRDILNLKHHTTALVLSVGLIVNINAQIFTLYLCLYHFWLKTKQKSTYEHILDKRQKNN